MLVALFAKIRKETSPQKIAENEYLMKCTFIPSNLLILFVVVWLPHMNIGPGVMRVIITSKQTMTPLFRDVLGNLVAILNEISKNPSNPSFDQYCFESISALLRYGNES